MTDFEKMIELLNKWNDDYEVYPDVTIRLERGKKERYKWIRYKDITDSKIIVCFDLEGNYLWTGEAS